jgi:hypothetical protein
MNLSRQTTRHTPNAKGLLYVDFNQDCGCFAIGLDSGYRIFNSDPLREKKRQDFNGRGIGIVSMLFRTNYLALVGGGRDPKFPPNHVILWDSAKEKEIVKIEFRSEVKNVKLRHDKMIIVLANKVYVYTFSAKPKCTHTFETYDNDKGKSQVNDISYN